MSYRDNERAGRFGGDSRDRSGREALDRYRDRGERDRNEMERDRGFGGRGDDRRGGNRGSSGNISFHTSPTKEERFELERAVEDAKVKLQEAERAEWEKVNMRDGQISIPFNPLYHWKTVDNNNIFGIDMFA
ncbi:hypothetical protein HK096_011522 [Nowakowskiella sp. JEL0078]|nr:hypothetical protein HK096_011522 [Nowakowskiella sp. JEL0078]